MSIASGYCGSRDAGSPLTFWCTEACERARRHVAFEKLPDSAFAAPTITRLAAQTTERLAVLDRVRPILSEAIHNAKGEEAVMAATFLGVRVLSAILDE